MVATAATATHEHLSADELRDAWLALSTDERAEGFQLLSRADAEELFSSLIAQEQAQLLLSLPPPEQRLWIRTLAPDDAADVIQEAPAEERDALLSLLDESTRKEVKALLAYAEDVAGGLMSPRFARVRPDMRVDEAIAYLRIQARTRIETIYYVYVLGPDQRLLGVLSFRELFAAPPDAFVRELMSTDVITVLEDTDQEAVSRLMAAEDLLAVPVVDEAGRLKGIVTIDDIVDVVQEEATEDIQKVGGAEALSGPYLETSFSEMVKKRAGWLTLLFVGEMFTATAMRFFEDEIASAVVLAVFLPLIIASGGNSGSQASTLVVRALALQDVRLRDWWRVLRREIGSGMVLGLILGSIALLRIAVWGEVFGTYGENAWRIGLTVATSLVGIVLLGTVVGSMLPFALRRLGFDPASASAPFVATLVDVTGIVIYFGLASLFLRGVLL